LHLIDDKPQDTPRRGVGSDTLSAKRLTEFGQCHSSLQKLADQNAAVLEERLQFRASLWRFPEEDLRDAAVRVAADRDEPFGGNVSPRPSKRDNVVFAAVR